MDIGKPERIIEVTPIPDIPLEPAKPDIPSEHPVPSKIEQDHGQTSFIAP